jgi:hypothetical protein
MLVWYEQVANLDVMTATSAQTADVPSVDNLRGGLWKPKNRISGVPKDVIRGAPLSCTTQAPMTQVQ